MSCRQSNVALANQWLSLCGRAEDSATESTEWLVVAAPGTLSRFHVRLTTAPGAGVSVTFNVYKNSNPTGITVTIADLNTTGSDLMNTAAVIAGDYITIQHTRVGVPAASHVNFGIEFTGSVAKQSLISGRSYSALSSAATQYATCMGYGAPSATENLRYQVISPEGTIKNLYVIMDASAGVNPDAYRFTLRKVGVGSTPLTVTITDPATTGNDLVNSVAVVAGDVIDIMIEPLNGPANTPRATWGFVFEATTDGQSPILGGDGSNISNNYYDMIEGAGQSGWNAVEASRMVLSPDTFTLKNLYALVNNAPGGAGKQDQITVYKNTLATAMLVIIDNAATTGNDLVNTVALASGDSLSIKGNRINTPAATPEFWGITLEEPAAPAAGGSQGNSMAAKILMGRLI